MLPVRLLHGLAEERFHLIEGDHIQFVVQVGMHRAGDDEQFFSRQALEERAESNELARWFGAAWNDLNIVTTFNLCYNAAVMAKQGLGYVVSLDKLVDTSEDSPLCFLPLEPRLESGLDVVWKKYQVFSAAAEAFLNRLREQCLK